MTGEAGSTLREKPWLPVVGVTVAAAVLALLAAGMVRLAARLPAGAPDVSQPTLAASDLLPTDPSVPVRGTADSLAKAVRASRRLSEADYVSSILGRNLFDPSQIGKKDDSPDGEAAPSDLKVTLKGTVVAVPANYSAAFIAEEGKERISAFGIGQKVQGAEILEILADRVRVRRATGAEEWLVLNAEKPESATATAASTGEGISGDGDTNFTIDRSTLTNALSNMDELSTMARALLHRGPDGEYDGYRLSAIRRDTLPDKVGIRNGDIIHSVNGLPINSLDGAMKALDALRSSPNLKVEVTRRGQPVALNYDIR